MGRGAGESLSEPEGAVGSLEAGTSRENFQPQASDPQLGKGLWVCQLGPRARACPSPCWGEGPSGQPRGPRQGGEAAEGA